MFRAFFLTKQKRGPSDTTYMFKVFAKRCQNWDILRNKRLSPPTRSHLPMLDVDFCVTSIVSYYNHVLVKRLCSLERRSPVKSCQLTSTLVGQHSTARLSIILASSGSSSSTAAFHKRTEFGTCSRARKMKKRKKEKKAMFKTDFAQNRTTHWLRIWIPKHCRFIATSNRLASHDWKRNHS